MLKKRVTIFTLAMLVASTINFIPAKGETTNLVKNPGFEEVTNNKPTNWNTNELANGVKVDVVSTDPHSGSKCLSIKNSAAADTMVVQDLAVEKNKIYKISFWVKSENIKNKPGSPNMTVYYGTNGHGCKGIYTSEEFQTTDGKWKQVTFQIGTRSNLDDPLSIGVRLGGQGTVNEGTAYFDDISAELVTKSDESLPFFKIDDNYGTDNGVTSNKTENASSSSPKNEAEKSPFNKTILFVIGGIIVLALIVFIEMKISKNKNDKPTNEANSSKSDDYDNDDEDDSI